MFMMEGMFLVLRYSNFEEFIVGSDGLQHLFGMLFDLGAISLIRNRCEFLILSNQPLIFHRVPGWMEVMMYLFVYVSHGIKSMP